MRVWTGLLGGLALAGVLALWATTASAQDWCGFHQKAGSPVKCGFSSLQQCKQALSDKKTGDKGVTCLPDPAFG
jgi:Protein of unknown function (DUF3551)